MFEHILQEPLWLRVWVFWLMAVNTASLVFLRHLEARGVLAAWVANLLLMPALFELQGYTRLLGLSHIVCWTPMLVWLARRRGRWPGPSTGAGAWLRLLVLSDAVSLAIDVVDVARFALGDRS